MAKYFIVLLTLAFCCQCTLPRQGKTPAISSFRIGFYNVENLFDTDDDPAVPFDNEFTPAGKKQWTPERYQTKLDRLAQVVEGMGYPALLGLAEVENRRVLEDFCEKTSLRAYGYGIAHFDSPDERGIDVALLFQKKYFDLLHAEPIRVDVPAEIAKGDPDPSTRDILAVELVFQKLDTLHLLVVHAPSRYGGQKETEPMRLFVARQIRQKVDAIFTRNPDANIVVMGDFNDEPSDPSVAEVLGAQRLTDPKKTASLYNCVSELDARGEGTYNYQGNWNMLDQVIFSTHLVGRENGLRFSNASIFRQDWMMYEDKKLGPRPNRTYGGDRYFGGYSDHLPVMVEVRRE